MKQKKNSQTGSFIDGEMVDCFCVNGKLNYDNILNLNK